MNDLHFLILDLVKHSPQRLDCQDIIDYFGLRADITMSAIRDLILSGFLKRINTLADGFNGHHYYTLTEKGENYNG